MEHGDDKAMPPFGAEVIVAERYTQEQEILAFGALGLSLGFLLGQIPLVAGLVLAMYRVRFLRRFIPLWLAWYANAIWRPASTWATEFNKYGWGAVGEERIVDDLRRHLDHDWTIFVSISLPDETGDIDVVLVGQSGVYVIEVKRPRTEDVGVALIRRLRKDVKEKKKQLATLLAQHGVASVVSQVVAFATEVDRRSISSDSPTPVWTPATLLAGITAIREAEQTLAASDVAAVRTVLCELVAAQERDARVPITLAVRILRLLLPREIRASLRG